MYRRLSFGYNTYHFFGWKRSDTVSFTALILAAGKSTRMRSKKPKFLHNLCGKPMLMHIVDAVEKSGADRIVVVIGHGGEDVKALLGHRVEYAWQLEAKGTGHAVQMAMPLFEKSAGETVVLYGDCPLLQPETIRRLVEYHRQERASATVLTAELEDPTRYGRIIRNGEGQVTAIIEEKDATPEQKKIKEINSGIYCFDTPALFAAIQKITPANAQGEYYLTDVIAILRDEGRKIAGLMIPDPVEIMGPNNRAQMSEAEREMRRRINDFHMSRGVTLIDPAATYIDSDVTIGADTVIYPGCLLQGKTTIGEDCVIGPHTRLIDSRLADGVQIQYSVMIESEAEEGAVIGPFTYIRPGSVLATRSKAGAFVELKKAKVGENSKVPHLTYAGDVTIGSGVNIGAGTIVVNYNGKTKNHTVVEDNAFVGCNTNLVAPVRVGKGAYVAAGSTITEDVPPGSLAIARERQVIKEGWADKFNRNDKE